MSKLNREQFNSLKEKLKASNEQQQNNSRPGIMRHSCRRSQDFDAFQKEIKAKSLTGVVLRRTGCMGLCASEPTVEIKVPGMADIIYGWVTPEVARDIVQKHVMRQILVSNCIQDKSFKDILKEGE
jgi:NADP-reducing hydrogenase subunit HndB